MDQMVFLLALACMAIPLSIAVRRQFANGWAAIAEPFWILSLFVAVGVVYKLVYLLFVRPPDIVAHLALSFDHVLYGNSISFLLPGLLAILLAMIFFGFGYFSARDSKFEIVHTNKEVYSKYLVGFIILALLISLISFAGLLAYENYNSITSGGNTKRFNNIEGGAINRLYEPRYYLYKLSTVSRYSFFLLLLYFVARGSINLRNITILFVVYLLGVVSTTYIGNRAHTLVSMLDVLVFAILVFSASRTHTGKSVRNNRYIAVAVVALSIVSLAIILVSTYLRYASEEHANRVRPIQQQDTASTSRPTRESEFYNVCRKRTKRLKELRNRQIRWSFWGIQAADLLPNGTGKKSAIVAYLDKNFEGLTDLDICTGRPEATNEQWKVHQYETRTLQLFRVLDRLLQGRYFVDVLKTAKIVRGFPEKVDFLNGQTLIGWLVVLVPRSVWPDKPIFIEISPLLSSVLFQQPNNNVPPGIIAELYLNFGWFGIVIGMFVMGWIMRYLFNSARANSHSLIFQLIYAMIMVRFTFIMFNTSFGDAALKSLIDITPIAVAYWLSLRSPGLKSKPLADTKLQSKTSV